MLSGILIKCMDFFSLLFWYILICVSNVIYPKMAYHIKFYKIETLKVKKKDISFKIRRYKWLYVVNQFEINESMHSKKIFVHIFNYTCILLLCSCTGKKELSFKLLRRFWNWWFLLLLKAHEISSFVLSAINFISHLDSNKYTIKKQEEVTKGYFGRVWA